MIYYRGLKFPHRAVVLLVLESDGACTGLNGHCARKSAVLVVVWCYKARGDREQELWGYWLPEGCIKQWCDKPSGYGCLSKKCEQGEHGAVTLLYLVPWPSCLTHRVKTQDLKRIITNHNPLCQSRQLSVLPLMFLKSLWILSGCPVINIRSCHQDRKLSWVGPMEYHPHTGFHYSKLLTYLWYDYSSFSNISGLGLGGSGYRQVVKWLRC